MAKKSEDLTNRMCVHISMRGYTLIVLADRIEDGKRYLDLEALNAALETILDDDEYDGEVIEVQNGYYSEYELEGFEPFEGWS